MPGMLGEDFLAPCGMNCLVCWRHCNSRRPCPGCLRRAGAAAGPCRRCAVRDCAEERAHRGCFECDAFPCRLVAKLERTYVKRYGVSLVANGDTARERGVAAFMEAERSRWGCPCGGVVSLHDGVCSECGRPVNPGEAKGEGT